ncbi:MAG: metal ABC transporter substrate-binding protein [Candidatus Thorarchaeota archaeon]
MPSQSLLKQSIIMLVLVMTPLFNQPPQFSSSNGGEKSLSCDKVSVSVDNDLNIVTTISIAKDWAEHIARGIYTVSTIVEGSENPHTYELTTREVERILEADVLIRLGLEGLEPWLFDILDTNPDLNSKLITLVQSNMVEYDSLIEANNPHVWMNPSNVKAMVRTIYQGLIALDPSENLTLTANYNEYIGQLDQLLLRINAIQSNFNGLKVVVHHPAFKYLFDLLDVTRVGIVQEKEGVPASYQHLKDLRQKMDVNDVQLIITQPQLEGEWDLIYQLARDTNAKVAYLTPLLGVYGLDSYIEMVDFDLNALENPKEPPKEETSYVLQELVLIILVFIFLLIVYRKSSSYFGDRSKRKSSKEMKATLKFGSAVGKSNFDHRRNPIETTAKSESEIAREFAQRGD